MTDASPPCATASRGDARVIVPSRNAGLTQLPPERRAPPYDAVNGLPSKEVAILFLSEGNPPKNMTCPVPTALEADTAVHGSGIGLPHQDQRANCACPSS